MSGYAGAFYSRRRTLTLDSARKILPIAFDEQEIKSIVDVGCGTGTWLAVARELGVDRAVGYEGTWVDQGMMDHSDIVLRHIDLSYNEIVAEEKFDMAISLEVAEHLPEERADKFVAQLCSLSERVLFSAAVPMQGGKSHINEQWQSYWAKKFHEFGYLACDVVRPVIWDDEAIPFYYRQNTFLYAKSNSAEKPMSFCARPNSMLDLVHPELLQKVAAEPPSTRQALSTVAGLPMRAVGRLMRVIRRSTRLPSK
jgi:SAM-dependent methyltransferase